jgi:hAT family C-terminal dimerisation region
MRRMWTEIEKFEGLKHYFFIPCDSHGIQLLVKDVITVLPGFSEVLRKAQLVAKSFRGAPLQYARLRELQVEHYGQHQSLVLSVISRWSTQFRLVSSLLKSKDSVKHYDQLFKTVAKSERLKNVVMDIIKDRDFWVKLEALRELLQPIDERLRMSKSGKSHLGHVLNRWADILKTLRTMSIEHQELETFISEGGPFMECYRNQVLPIHVVAYYLIPETALCDIDNDFAPIPIEFEKKILDFFRRYSSSEEECKHMSREFNFFRSQQSPFETARQCWEEYKDPYLFWHFASGLALALAKLAFRIFESPVNSVASERAVSVQNLIHSKMRNRLLPERANKPEFIYTNAHILEQQNIPTVDGGPSA